MNAFFPKMKQRDEQLDIFRGLVMIYIVCVVHVYYSWICAPLEPHKSLILFEMPLIFFISGAALQISDNRRSIGSQLVNRAKRVLLPYYVYIGIIIAILLLSKLIFGDSIRINQSINIDFKNILLPLDWPTNIPDCAHLWFIVPFMVISCSFPLQRKFVDKINASIYMLLCFIAFGLSCLFDSCVIQEIFGYNIFFMMGYFYYRRLKIKSIITIFLASTSLLITSLTIFGYDFTPMLQHKFPPDFIFITYGIVVLSLLGVMFSYIRLRNNWFIKRWNKHCYTIYLWQPVMYMGFYWMIRKIGLNCQLIAQPWRFIFLAVGVFLFSTCVSFVTVPIERWVIKYVDVLVDRFKRWLALN